MAYRGCAILVAWHIVPATAQGRWRPHWERLLTQVAAGVPDDWLVSVLADRGLYARWLFRAIVAQHWHPFLRINQQGQYRPSGSPRFRPLATVVRRDTPGWSGTVECFASSSCRLCCTLLAQWTEPHADPWLILTDLPPEAADTTAIAPPHRLRHSRPHLLSCFRRGVIHICATLLSARPLPLGHFVPLPWPSTFQIPPPLPLSIY